ncbi:MAG: hypothetical protein M3011_00335 [Actinomycetota bacterium]|nr:hypothetical protein [Actinomycetota bacterium]
MKPAPANGAPTAQADPDTVQPGDSTRITGAGFGAGESLNLTLCSTPVSLGKVTAGPSGDVAATITIPAGTAIGTHTVVVSNATGSRVALATITVVAPSGSIVVPVSGGGNALVRTGTDTTRMTVLAALILIMGVFLVRAGKFRRYAAPWNRRNRW